MMLKGLSSRDAKKKFLGALIIVAFVAFFANVVTKYIVISEIGLGKAASAAVVIIVALLIAMEVRHKRATGKRKKKRPKRKKKR